MTSASSGATSRIAVLVAAEGIEQVELTQPWQALQEAGWEPVLVSPEEGKVQAFNHLEAADTFPVDQTVAQADVEDFAGLLLPGGVANPDALRLDAGAVDLVRAFSAKGLPTAAICHAIWLLVEADVVRDRTVTSFPSLQTDVRNAGGTWVDEEVVVDGHLVTSRTPDDLPAFDEAFLRLLGEGQA